MAAKGAMHAGSIQSRIANPKVGESLRGLEKAKGKN